MRGCTDLSNRARVLAARHYSVRYIPTDNGAVHWDATGLGSRTLKPKASAGLASLAVVVQLVAGCADQERFRGRTTEQVKQACDPQRQSPEEGARTLDR
jgi:hypothetical protein